MADRINQDEINAILWKACDTFRAPHPETSIRSMEKRWGNCIDDGRIILNLRLIQAPRSTVDYVIVHELCHLKEHHHGRAFYAMLDRVMPDWRDRRAALHQVELT